MPLKTTAGNHGAVAKGRGATINPEGRFENFQREAYDDEWFQEPPEGEEAKPKTVIAIERVKTIITRNESPDLGFDRSLNPYRGCAHGCSYCTSGLTPILMADGRTRPMSELRAGDEIYGTTFDGKYRRYAKTTVLDHWSVIKPAYRTVLEDGTELITSGDHRFLSDRGWKYVTGAEQGPMRRPFLTTNNKLMGTGRFAEGPSEDGDYRRGYLCGMLRGDAHIGYPGRVSRNGAAYGRSVVRLALVDPEALLRCDDYLAAFGFGARDFVFSNGTQSRRPISALSITGKAPVAALRELIAWPTDVKRSWATGFLAGIFDAEGHFGQTVLRISNTDLEIIDWIVQCMDVLGFTYVIEQLPFSDRKPMNIVRLKGGLPEQLRFLHAVRPAITRKLNLEGQALKSNARLEVVSIESFSKGMRLYDITTGTGDFIADGVVSHNCFARPSHAYYGLSPGIDFETRLTAKVNAAEKLREELAKPGYRVEPIAVGVNTDAYQPIEREHRITRSVLEVLHEVDHPVTLITKNALIERDLDLLAPMAEKRLVHATITLTTLDHGLSRYLEPRATAPTRRLLAVERLAKAGIPVNVNVAPVIPFLTDHELENILEAAANAGAQTAYYTLLRLPWEVKDIFKAWLEEYFPLKAAHVMARVHEMREGRDNDPNFGTRMTGTGLFAKLLRQRYEKASARLGLNRRADIVLERGLFKPPSLHGQQDLF